jgi:hypothetical protein
VRGGHAWFPICFFEHCPLQMIVATHDKLHEISQLVNLRAMIIGRS